MYKVNAETKTVLLYNTIHKTSIFISKIEFPSTFLRAFGPRQVNLVLIAYAAAKVQASLRIRAVSPEPPLLAHTSSESRGTFRQKARSLAPLNGWACAVKICHDRMLEDTNSLGGAHFISKYVEIKE